MITLYQFAPAFGLPNASSFCMKVETYLRLAQIEYGVSYITNPSKAPKGKCPYIKDHDKIIADSHFILKYLKAAYGDPLGHDLTVLERARHHALARMMEEHLYFAILFNRWLIPENATIIRDVFFADAPGFMKNIVFSLVQRSMKKSLWAQGIGRHKQEEIEALAIEDLVTLSDTLGADDFFGGQRPREIDCTAWSFIANLVQAPLNGRIHEAARSLQNLVIYHQRMMHHVFPEILQGRR